jgi:nucleotidyltransferase AbiEii toxin of type IV toxin-antitoxin system
MKPARRAAAPARASLPRNIETSLKILDLCWSLKNGGSVRGEKFPRQVHDLFDRLDREGVEWVLIGAQAINLYLLRPRATVDVDIVVRKKHLRKAIKVLQAACGAVEESEVHFKAELSPAPERLGVDLIKSTSHALFEEALDRKVQIEGIPAASLEALLALKFLSIVSPWRSIPDKFQDSSDLTRAFLENRPRVDRALFIELASLASKNARAVAVKLLDAIENGKPITI